MSAAGALARLRPAHTLERVQVINQFYTWTDLILFWGLLALCIAFAVLPWLVPFLIQSFG